MHRRYYCLALSHRYCSYGDSTISVTFWCDTKFPCMNLKMALIIYKVQFSLMQCPPTKMNWACSFVKNSLYCGWRSDQIHHYSDVIMGAIASQITSLTIVYSTVDSEADQRKHQSSASLAFVQAGNSPGTGEFPAQMASNAENVSIWWRHHDSE